MRVRADRNLTDYAKVRWLISRLRRNSRLLNQLNCPTGAYLNLGCGPNIVEGFVNIDAGWVPGLDVCWDITRGLPFQDGAIGGIFSEHCLEHLPLAEGRALLRECWRVLAPGSVIRLVVPDLELYARSYVKRLDGIEAPLPLEYFTNRWNVAAPVALFNELFYGSGHRFIYDFQVLSGLLGEARFDGIRRCSFGAGGDQRLQIDSPGRRSESLYIEARKGAAPG
jgi:predicted SAM-dependent methyltransferase